MPVPFSHRINASNPFIRTSLGGINCLKEKKKKKGLATLLIFLMI